MFVVDNKTKLSCFNYFTIVYLLNLLKANLWWEYHLKYFLFSWNCFLQCVFLISISRHIFHKSCVDPWLLDQRSCPMCKLDILRAYGMHVRIFEKNYIKYSVQ